MKKKILLFLVFLLSVLVVNVLCESDDIYCPRCGVKNEIGNNFCKNCGLPLAPIRKYLLEVSQGKTGNVTVSSPVSSSSSVSLSHQENYQGASSLSVSKNNVSDPIAEKLKNSLLLSSGDASDDLEKKKPNSPKSSPKKVTPSSENSSPMDALPPRKKQLLNEIESIFDSKSGPSVPVTPVVNKNQDRESVNKIVHLPQRNKNVSTNQSNTSSLSPEPPVTTGKLEISITYSGDEIEKYEKYGKVYLNGKYIGKIYRFLKQKKGSSYVNYFTKTMSKYVKSRFLSEVVYKFEKDGIPPGIYSIKVILKKKIVWGYSKEYTKKWRGVKFEPGIVTKLIYQWNDAKDFGE